eukprot:gene61797-biopygen28290
MGTKRNTLDTINTADMVLSNRSMCNAYEIDMIKWVNKTHNLSTPEAAGEALLSLTKHSVLVTERLLKHNAHKKHSAFKDGWSPRYMGNKMSTMTATLQYINALEDARETGQPIHRSSWDMSKAFDTVSKPAMMIAWLRLGVPEQIATWLVGLDMDGVTIVRTPSARRAWQQDLTTDPEEIHKLLTNHFKDWYAAPVLSEDEEDIHTTVLDWQKLSGDENYFMEQTKVTKVPDKYRQLAFAALQVQGADEVKDQLTRAFEEGPSLEDFITAISTAPKQSAPGVTGFTNKMSTMTATLQYINALEDARETGQPIHRSSWDMSKAFDTVSKPAMMIAWLRLGVPEQIATWLGAAGNMYKSGETAFADDMESTSATNSGMQDKANVVSAF